MVATLMRRLLLATVVAVAGVSVGCGDPAKTENTGTPIELNKSKNAPKGYGTPDGGAVTGVPKK